MSSAELWRELEDRYEQPNGAKLYQIQMEINDLSQGSLDITGYYTKLKKLWEELGTLNVTTQCNCACNCGAKALAHKAEQGRRLIEFLMGLNEIYTVIHGSILMMNPLPNMAQAFSLLVQDEHQREIKPSNHFNVDSTALHVGSDIFCNYCRRTGHLMKKCYQLHGYPSGSSSGPISNNDNSNQKTYPYNSAPRPNNFRPPKPPQNTNTHIYPRGSGNRPVANAHCTYDSTPGNGPLVDQHDELYNMNLTKDQYDHVQSMLQQFHTENKNEGSTTNSALANGQTDFADSGASHHMTFNRPLLHNITLMPYPMLIALPNGYKVKLTQIGNVTLGPMISLQKAPSMKRPLVLGNADDGYFQYSCQILL
ncbi:hypothetical protein KY290_013947 [Solanum tuberosum]|uniref:Retrotransposon gag domain-containing protein n=1 Tax=Solanum tuberosum TaxID=4113 RepID=A0ABQ7VPI3_SOLTU|nr:hypothetical protein KY290_013947 [Solanum tuberosum]